MLKADVLPEPRTASTVIETILGSTGGRTPRPIAAAGRMPWRRPA